MSDPAPDPQGLPPGYPFKPDWEFTPRQVKQLRDAGHDLLLLDCRTPGEWHTARIDGATLLPMQETVERLSELDAHRQRKIIVYCHHGMRSLQVTSFLRRQGFADVRSMAGGIDLWSTDIDAGVPRY